MISDYDLMSIINNPYEHSTRSVRMARELLAYRQAFSEPYAYEVKGILCHTLEEAKIFLGDPEPLFLKPTIPE